MTAREMGSLLVSILVGETLAGDREQLGDFLPHSPHVSASSSKLFFSSVLLSFESYSREKTRGISEIHRGTRKLAQKALCVMKVRTALILMIRRCLMF